MCCEGKTTLEKGGKDPPNVSLEYIVNDLLTYFNEFKSLDNAKTDAEVKYGINNEHDNCWPADDIKRAWGKTQRLRKTSCSRRLWALVIMLQVIQKQQAGNSSQGCADPPDQMKARKRREIGEDDLGSTGNIDQDLGKTKCRKEHPEDISSDGLPGTGTDSVVMKRKSYVMSFNRDTMNANWVYEILNRNTVPENPVERAKFVDPYQRGHLAAAANQKWCCEALDDANMIDNIVPQHRDLNTGPWKSLEEYCRRTARDPNIRNVHVYSGPLYLDENPRVIQGKRVPSHFFKVIIEENEIGTVKLRCHQAPNGNLPLENLNTNTNTTIENIQQNSGLTFIQNRPNTGQNAAAHEIRVTLHGEDENAVPRTAEIQVTTSPFV